MKKRIDIRLIGLSLVLIIIGCVVYFYCSSVTKPTLAITEICYKNKTCAYDENGEYGADYIELYNNSEEPIDLYGYGLSDKKKDLYRFVFQDIANDIDICLIRP